MGQEAPKYKDRRYSDLIELGFDDVWVDKIKRRHPALFANQTGTVNAHKQRGFINPIKLINAYPQILSLSTENIDAKLSGLKQRGFDDVSRLVTKFPQVLGLTLENIDAKLSGLKQRG